MILGSDMMFDSVHRTVGTVVRVKDAIECCVETSTGSHMMIGSRGFNNMGAVLRDVGFQAGGRIIWELMFAVARI